jgi:hypothetical protein
MSYFYQSGEIMVMNYLYQIITAQWSLKVVSIEHISSLMKEQAGSVPKFLINFPLLTV